MLDKLYKDSIDLFCASKDDSMDSIMMDMSIHEYNRILSESQKQRKRYDRFMKTPYDFIGRLDKKIKISPIASTPSLSRIIYGMCLVEPDGGLPLFPHERIVITSRDDDSSNISLIDDDYKKRLMKSAKKIAKKMNLSEAHIDIIECYRKLFKIVNGIYNFEYDEDFIKFNILLNLLPYCSEYAVTVYDNNDRTDIRRMNVLISLWIYRYISQVCLNRNVPSDDFDLFLKKKIDSIIHAVSLL